MVKGVNQLLLVIKLIIIVVTVGPGVTKVCVVSPVPGPEVKCWVMFAPSRLQEAPRYVDPHRIIERGVIQGCRQRISIWMTRRIYFFNGAYIQNTLRSPQLLQSININ